MSDEKKLYKNTLVLVIDVAVRAATQQQADQLTLRLAHSIQRYLAEECGARGDSEVASSAVGIEHDGPAASEEGRNGL